MSMLSCRALCLLVIVLYCVGVANANAANPQAGFVAERLKRVHKIAGETVKNKVECEKVMKSAQDAARNARAFVAGVKNSLQELAANPTEVENKKKKGYELIKKAMKAANKAETVCEKTHQKAEDISQVIDYVVDIAQEYGDSFRQQVDTLLTDTKMNMETIMTNAKGGAKEAEAESGKVHTAVMDVKGAVKEVEDAIKNLEAAVDAAKKKKNR
ncbi:hypothetical protein LSM04_001736 [Trypanosoma melophagium]|uniref:uncharacterized protein n=1 Tax=Trypanosoma melophagium TaxID=715481 RepID=UPI00351A87A2|nr:hypothetical protein LSM04_001736 [Trypanosoma melophagium]